MKANELLDNALEFIVDTQEENDYICEQMTKWFGDYCENNCQNLNKKCVKLFLQEIYNREQSYESDCSTGEIVSSSKWVNQLL